MDSLDSLENLVYVLVGGSYVFLNVFWYSLLIQAILPRPTKDATESHVLSKAPPQLFVKEWWPLWGPRVQGRRPL